MNKTHHTISNILFTLLFISIFLTSTLLTATSMPDDSQVYEEYQENFNDGQAQNWILDHWKREDEAKWEVDTKQGMLVGRGEVRAYFTEGDWTAGKFTLRFKLMRLFGTVLAKIHVNGPDHYAIGFQYMGHDTLHLFLSRTLPNGLYENLGMEDIFYERPDALHNVEIFTEDGKITVSVDGYPWIIYTDPEPLPVGTIAFENVEAVNAIDDIVVVAMKVSADARATETSTPTPTETPTTTPEETPTSTPSPSPTQQVTQPTGIDANTIGILAIIIIVIVVAAIYLTKRKKS